MATVTTTRTAAPSTRALMHPIVLAWSALVAGLVAIEPLRALQRPEATDWVSYATGGRLVESTPRDLFHPAAQLAAQTQLLGHAPTIGLNEYANPPLLAWLLSPLAGLPLRVGLLAWTLVLSAALVVTIAIVWDLFPRSWSSWQRCGVAVAAVGLLATLDGVGYAQVDALALAPTALGIRVLLRRGDAVTAGLLLSAVAAKPQLVWLLLPVLLFARAWRTGSGLLLGGLAWLVSGVILVGGQAMVGWVRDTLPGGYVGQTGRGAGGPGLLVALGLPDGWAFAAAALLGAAGLVAAWRMRARLRLDPALAVGVGLLLSTICSPHSFGRDVALATLPLLVVIALRRPSTAWWLAVGSGLAFTLDADLPLLLAHLMLVAAVVTLVAALRVVSQPAESGWRLLPAASGLTEDATRSTTAAARPETSSLRH